MITDVNKVLRDEKALSGLDNFISNIVENTNFEVKGLIYSMDYKDVKNICSIYG